jgi:hypothetical protein
MAGSGVIEMCCFCSLLFVLFVSLFFYAAHLQLEVWRLRKEPGAMKGGCRQKGTIHNLLLKLEVKDMYAAFA